MIEYHEQENAHPGYYQVLLTDDSINVELTATLRAGMHRYTYPKASDARLILDMEPTIHGLFFDMLTRRSN